VRAWTTATAPGRCSYCGREWKQTDRVFAVQGTTWRKLFCDICAKERQDAPPDTGEILDIESTPKYPRQLLEFTGVTRDLFDAKDAALPPRDRADYDDRPDDALTSVADLARQKLKDEVGF
jgi:hypothetical protein